MGIYYDAVFGFGVEVDDVMFEGMRPSHEDRSDYLDRLLDDTYYYIYEGDYGYSLRPYTYYIILRESLFDGKYNVEQEVEEFESFLREKGINFKGKTGIVGGILVH